MLQPQKRFGKDAGLQADPVDSDQAMERFLSGVAIFGDDFTSDQIRQWYADEAEAYAELGAGKRDCYRYHYHAMNELHGFRFLPKGRSFPKTVGFGSAYGEELLPIVDRLDSIAIVDPSDAFVGRDIGGRPATWLKPVPSGVLPFASESIDLITCFGVLHHIPNVSFVLREFRRVLKPGGYCLVREPIVSMGDWRKPRKGATARERGLPLPVFDEAISRAGLEVVTKRLMGFGPLLWLLRKFNYNPYNSKVITRVDWLLAHLSNVNYRYHSEEGDLIQRFRPTAAYWVLRHPVVKQDE